MQIELCTRKEVIVMVRDFALAIMVMYGGAMLLWIGVGEGILTLLWGFVTILIGIILLRFAAQRFEEEHKREGDNIWRRLYVQVVLIAWVYWIIAGIIGIVMGEFWMFANGAVIFVSILLLRIPLSFQWNFLR